MLPVEQITALQWSFVIDFLILTDGAYTIKIPSKGAKGRVEGNKSQTDDVQDLTALPDTDLTNIKGK